MDPATTLSGIDAGLRSELVLAFASIVRNYREHRWEPSELNGGKLCEVVYSVLKGYTDGKWPTKATKPKNMVDACKDLEKADSNRFSRSIRIQIPRLLVALYEIRNNRGVGHVGGDVDPNGMDARIVLEGAKWVVAELVRVFHSVSTEEATEAVEQLTERTLPIVWEIGDTRRVLDPTLSTKDQVLLLLYSCRVPATVADLFSWTEHSHTTRFKNILTGLHKARLIEFDRASGRCSLTPVGTQHVEDNLPLTYK